MHHNNKIGIEADSSSTSENPFISDDDMGDVAPPEPDLQSVLDGILDKVGRERQTLYRGYQLRDNKDAEGNEINERWSYVPERGSDEFLARTSPMFATVCASTYRKGNDDVSRADALSLSRFAYFDFDGDSIDTVLPKVRQFIGKLTDAGADATALHIYASGGKGFHVMVPLEMFLLNGLQSLTLEDVSAFPSMIKVLAEELHVDTLDSRVYTSSRQWRRENVERARGTYKVPVSLAEIMSMDADAYAVAVASPREDIARTAPKFADGLGQLWREARAKVAKQQQAKAQRAAQRAARPPIAPEELERYTDALYAIDPDAGEYFDWYACVAGTHDKFDGSDEGFALVDEWSKQGRKYSYQALLGTWEGLDSGLAGGNVITDASVYKFAREAGWIDRWPHLNPRNQVDHPSYRLRETDEGFAEHVATVHGDRLRYVSELKAWAVFDGRSWVIESGIATAKDMAKSEARAYQAKAAAIQPTDDTEEVARKKSLGFATGLENNRKLENIVSKMGDDPRLITSVGVFDDRPYLLNLVNGTYDLERDEMRGHDAADYLMQRMHVSRDPNAQCPRWLRFIDEITQGNKVLAAYLQCIAGLCLSGDVSQQEAYILFGSGANGKSVFTGIIRELCGDYFKPLDVQVLVYSNKVGMNNTEMASLRGARAVATSELERGVVLRSGNFKDLTGGDAMQVSDKYVKAFTLKPQCTILIPTNHLPTITENDHGIWRRVVIIPFNARFEGASLDPDLSKKLRAELPGILNWAIDGFRAFRGGKMVVPDCVKELSVAYRDELDIAKNFTEQWLVEDEPGREDCGRIMLDDLYVMFTLYCKASGLRGCLSKRMFKEDIAAYLPNQTMKARQPVYQGWRIRAEYVPDTVMGERFSKASHAAKSLQYADDVDD